jgi:hypothetical protein
VLLPESTHSSDAHDNAAPFRQYVHDNYRLTQIFALDGNSRYEEDLWELEPKSNN